MCGIEASPLVGLLRDATGYVEHPLVAVEIGIADPDFAVLPHNARRILILRVALKFSPMTMRPSPAIFIKVPLEIRACR
jgi:hypothetical protein